MQILAMRYDMWTLTFNFKEPVFRKLKVPKGVEALQFKGVVNNLQEIEFPNTLRYFSGYGSFGCKVKGMIMPEQFEFFGYAACIEFKELETVTLYWFRLLYM